MDAIITAGGVISPEDPLLALTGVAKKALIPLAGRPMVNWVVNALVGSGLVEHIVIVGLKPSQIEPNRFPVHYVDSVGGIVDNILTAFDRLKEINPSTKKVLISSSDIPLITSASIQGFVAECGAQEADVYYAIVEKETMESRFPESKRTFVPFKNGRYCGGDIFLADVEVPVKADLDLLRTLTGHRKNYWSQVRLLGLKFIFRFLLGIMTTEEAARRGSEILNFDARGVVTRFAELGMDLDKPRQYQMIRAELEKREARLRQA